MSVEIWILKFFCVLLSINTSLLSSMNNIMRLKKWKVLKINISKFHLRETSNLSYYNRWMVEWTEKKKWFNWFKK